MSYEFFYHTGYWSGGLQEGDANTWGGKDSSHARWISHEKAFLPRSIHGLLFIFLYCCRRKKLWAEFQTISAGLLEGVGKTQQHFPGEAPAGKREWHRIAPVPLPNRHSLLRGTLWLRKIYHTAKIISFSFPIKSHQVSTRGKASETQKCFRNTMFTTLILKTGSVTGVAVKNCVLVHIPSWMATSFVLSIRQRPCSFNSLIPSSIEAWTFVPRRLIPNTFAVSRVKSSVSTLMFWTRTWVAALATSSR